MIKSTQITNDLRGFCYSVPKGYAVIVVRPIMLKWTCVERFAGVPIDYGLLTSIYT